MKNNKENFRFVIELFMVLVIFCLAILFLCNIMYTYVSNGELEVLELGEQSIQVIIDPGHGGRDGGASSNNGVLEKDLNLSVSFLLNDLLKLCGINTAMTRDSDRLVCDENDPELRGRIKMTDLRERANLSLTNPEAMFISIHMNKFPIEKYNGLQTYYSANNPKSMELAKAIQNRVVEILQPNNNRKIKKAGSEIFVLDKVDSPAILIECGFLSNPDDVENLSQSTYRTKLSLIIVDTIMANMN